MGWKIRLETGTDTVCLMTGRMRVAKGTCDIISERPTDKNEMKDGRLEMKRRIEMIMLISSRSVIHNLRPQL